MCLMSLLPCSTFSVLLVLETAECITLDLNYYWCWGGGRRIGGYEHNSQ